MKLLALLIVVMIVVLVGIFTKDKTFTHRLALAVDILFASMLWSGYDVTVSSRAGMAVRAKISGLKYSKSLVLVAWLLNKIQANHVELAITDDVTRASDALKYLGVASIIGAVPASPTPLPGVPAPAAPAPAPAASAPPAA